MRKNQRGRQTMRDFGLWEPNRVTEGRGMGDGLPFGFLLNFISWFNICGLNWWQEINIFLCFTLFTFLVYFEFYILGMV